ncbi:hypothetical protein [Mucilaginibacter corticis]|uniref:hypothetical protein n=1 Tax=Mucilaginibacter corticis TaxID=2597670 RepID=UPI00164270B5|nr:hypothetical protein [Mucilaginibacter corticis]
MKLTDEEIIIEVYEEFGAVIEKQGDEFVIVDTDILPGQKKYRAIKKLIAEFQKN